MKRVIRSSVATEPDLSYEVNGKTYYLPTWCRYWADDEIREAKEQAVQSMLDAESIDWEQAEFDSILPDEEEEEMIKKLREAGFNWHEVDSIIYDISRGMTLDAAMQNIREGF